MTDLSTRIASSGGVRAAERPSRPRAFDDSPPPQAWFDPAARPRISIRMQGGKAGYAELRAGWRAARLPDHAALQLALWAGAEIDLELSRNHEFLEEAKRSLDDAALTRAVRASERAADAKVLECLVDVRWDFRSVEGIARSAELTPQQVQAALDRLGGQVRNAVPDATGRDLYTAASRPLTWREKYMRIWHRLATW